MSTPYRKASTLTIVATALGVILLFGAVFFAIAIMLWLIGGGSQ